LREFAQEISSRSYVPYSGNANGCFVLGNSGTFYPGARIENISFPLTIPANQAAICNCLGNADRPKAIYYQDSQESYSDIWVNMFELERLTNIPDHPTIYNPLLQDVDDILFQLKQLTELTVSNKSNFPVTALLKVESGYIAGVNIEFDEWNLGLCAERVAISRAIAGGYSNFTEIHVYAPKSEFISPCGACRQVLYELMSNQLVYLHHDEESTTSHFVSHLLPNGLTTNSLKT